MAAAARAAAAASAAAEALHNILSDSNKEGKTAGSRWKALKAAMKPPNADKLIALKRLAAAAAVPGHALIGKDVMEPLVSLAESHQTGAEHAVATLLVLHDSYPKEVVDAL